MAFIHKHTKGSWIIKNDFRCPKVLNESGQVMFEHNNCYDNTDNFGEKLHTYYSHNKMMSNCKLIAAAPELLECAEMLHDMLDNEESRNSIAMYAVKKVLQKVGVIESQDDED